MFGTIPTCDGIHMKTITVPKVSLTFVTASSTAPCYGAHNYAAAQLSRGNMQISRQSSRHTSIELQSLRMAGRLSRRGANQTNTAEMSTSARRERARFEILRRRLEAEAVKKLPTSDDLQLSLRLLTVIVSVTPSCFWWCWSLRILSLRSFPNVHIVSLSNGQV
eukprot:6212290-Pleurochrysis_carterae.AAC.2